MSGAIQCVSCGKQSSSDHRFCASCGAGFPVPPTAPFVPYMAAHPSEVARLISSMMSRYSEGYQYARTINGLGILIQVVACIVGVILMLAGLSAYSRTEAGGLLAGESQAVAMLLILIGALIGAIGYIHGVIVRASGQFLKAHFDCAIFQSPFLTNDQRIAAMQLK
jgi:hypothetical protein